MLYHPWREVRMLPDWRVIFRRLDGPAAYTHRPSRTVVIEERLGQAARRCTIAHELEHIRAGHHGCQPAGVERAITDAFTRRLLPLTRIICGLRWTRDVAEFAEYVWVDMDTAEHRLNNLSIEEQRVVEAALDGIEKTT